MNSLDNSANGPDPRAVAAGHDLRERLDAECVILLGSRARGDYQEHKSDVDFIVIIDEQIDRAAEIKVRATAAKAIESHYGHPMSFDSIPMTPDDYVRMSRHTVNHPATSAAREGVFMAREGVFMARNEGEYGRERREETEHRKDYQDEYKLTNDRIADANASYNTMQHLIDVNDDQISVLRHAQIALEHGLKTYISARTSSYGTTHNLTELARRMSELLRRDADSEPISFRSDLERLSAFSGSQTYGPLTGGEDYRQLSNTATEDLINIYHSVEQLTGKDPWEIPTRLSGIRVEPRAR